MKKISKITRLRRQRIALNMSQRELGEKVGVATSSIGGYERGENPLSRSMAIKMAEALGLSLEALFSPHKSLKDKFIAK